MIYYSNCRNCQTSNSALSVKTRHYVITQNHKLKESLSPVLIDTIKKRNDAICLKINDPFFFEQK